MKKFIATVLKVLVFLGGWIFLASRVTYPKTNDPMLGRLYAEGIPFLILIGFTYVFWVIEKRNMKIYLIEHLSEGFRFGLEHGLAWIGLTFVVFNATGTAQIKTQNNADQIAVWILACVINVCMQEFLVRGYLFQLLRSEYNVAAATIVSTAVYVLINGTSWEEGLVPFLIVVSLSLLMTAILQYTESLVAPIVAHSIWNVVAGIVLNGIALPDDYPNMFIMSFSGDRLLSGGALHFDGSVITLAMNAVFLIIVLRLSSNVRNAQLGKILHIG